VVLVESVPLDFLFREIAMECKSIDEFSSPLKKLVQFFQASRDSWKAKYQAIKADHKLLQNQTRAVEKSRELWRKRAFKSQKRLKELERELDNQKKLLNR
jgi:Skp family chaperone for outer membrane proteins